MNEAAASSFSDDFQMQICPSLKHIATFKILIAMWNHLDDESIKPLSKDLMLVKLTTDQLRIEDNIEELKLPKLLKNQLLHFNDFIGERICEWKGFFSSIGCRNYCKKFVWTDLGRLNKIKTARKILNDESELKVQYIISCCFCFENDIKRIWQNLDSYDEFYVSLTELCLVNFWWIAMAKGIRSNALGATTSIVSNNEIGARFFLELIELDLRERVLLESLLTFIDPPIGNEGEPLKFPEYQKNDVIYFIFSEMNREQKIEILKVKYAVLTKCFLSWPWCLNLTKFFNFLWNYCKNDIFFKVIDIVCVENFLLFEEFWQECSSAVRIEIAQWFGKSSQLFEIVRQIRDFEMVKLILKFVNSSIALASLSQKLNNYNNLICNKDDKWESYFLLVKNEIKTLLLCKRNQIFVEAERGQNLNL